jgi:hypothetical protein
MAEHSVFSTAARTPSAQMDAAPDAAVEVVDEACRAGGGQFGIVGSATCVDTATSERIW